MDEEPIAQALEAEARLLELMIDVNDAAARFRRFG